MAIASTVPLRPRRRRLAINLSRLPFAIPSRQLDWLGQEHRLNQKRVPLSRRPRKNLPEIAHGEEAVARFVRGDRQRRLRSEREDFVAAANEDVWETLDMVVADLPRAVVNQAGGECPLQEVTTHTSLEVQLVADLRLAV